LRKLNTIIGGLAVAAMAAVPAGLLNAAPAASAAPSVSPLLSGLHTPKTVASTADASGGELNPYGVAIVPADAGRLRRGHILVSNFNDSQNRAGRGTTIVDVAPDGKTTLFSRVDPAKVTGCPGGATGLTTALAVLRSGWVIAGALPTADGTPATAKAGCLLVLDANGRVVRSIANRLINGPWDMTAVDRGARATLFVSNVLNGTVAGNGSVVNGGSVVRLELASGDGSEAENRRAPRLVEATVIGSGFAERTDPAALVLGPTGLGLGKDGTLYVADTLASRIASIPAALSRSDTTFAGEDVLSTAGALNGPLGLAVAPNGDIVTLNANDANAVETTPAGAQVATMAFGANAGDLFGLAVTRDARTVYFGNDGKNTLDVVAK
jgi:hypothetical protein